MFNGFVLILLTRIDFLMMSRLKDPSSLSGMGKVGMVIIALGCLE